MAVGASSWSAVNCVVASRLGDTQPHSARMPVVIRRLMGSRKISMQTPTRLLLGEGRTNREAIDTCTCSICRGIGRGHVGMVMRVIGGDPSTSEVAASTPLMAVDQVGVGQGRMTVEAG